MVSAGRTLLLPCRGSDQVKQRWFHRRTGKKRQAIFTRFRNGTVKEEREDADDRFRLDQDALQILDLQLEDAGEYLCNRELEARVIVLAGAVFSLFCPFYKECGLERKTDEPMNIYLFKKKNPFNISQ